MLNMRRRSKASDKSTDAKDASDSKSSKTSGGFRRRGALYTAAKPFLFIRDQVVRCLRLPWWQVLLACLLFIAVVYAVCVRSLASAYLVLNLLVDQALSVVSGILRKGKDFCKRLDTAWA